MKNVTKTTLGIHDFRKQINNNTMSLGYPGAPQINISKSKDDIKLSDGSFADEDIVVTEPKNKM